MQILNMTFLQKVRLYDELSADWRFLERYWAREDYIRRQRSLAKDFEDILAEKVLSEEDRTHVSDTLNQIRQELAEMEEALNQAAKETSQGEQDLTQAEQDLAQVKEELAQTKEALAQAKAAFTAVLREMDQKDAKIAALRRQLAEQTGNP